MKQIVMFTLTKSPGIIFALLGILMAVINEYVVASNFLYWGAHICFILTLATMLGFILWGTVKRINSKK